MKVSRVSLTGKPPKTPEWRTSACKVQTVMHSCYAHGDTARAKDLESRRFVPHNRKCLDFNPELLLERIKGRSLLLYGDSVMMQLWQSLVCACGSLDLSVSVSVDWYRHNSSSQMYYSSAVCPYGAEHCHLHGGSAFFPKFNSSISFRLFGWYEKLVENHAPLHNTYQIGLLSKLVKRNNLRLNDFLVINWGLHAHDRADYRQRLLAFRQDLRKVPNSNPRQIFFMETWPQHFAKGYYDFIERTDAIDLKCHPLPKDSDKDDWKNYVAREVLSNVSNLIIIPVAKVLRSQHDAHIQATSKLVKFAAADCTHWCLPSGVFNYASMMLMNTIR